MAVNDREDHQQPSWLGLAKGLFIVVFALGCLLLIRAMVENHFFSGGALNYQMSKR